MARPNVWLSPTEWATLRAEFETGAYASVDDFFDRFVAEKYRKRVKLRTIRDKVTEESWTKKALEPQIKANVERLSVEMYTRLGLPPERVAQVTAKAINDVLATEEELMDRIRRLAAPGTAYDDAAFKAFVELARKYVVDKNCAAKFADQYHKVTGAYAAQEVKHSGHVTVGHNLAGMSADEKLKLAEDYCAKCRAMLTKEPRKWTAGKV